MMKRSRGPLIVSLCSLAGVFALVVAAGCLLACQWGGLRPSSLLSPA